MKLGAFIAQLQEIQEETPDLDVMISRDAEGNKIKDYEGWTTGHYSGELDEYWTEDDFEEVEDEDEEPLTVNTLVLYPY
ncbi:hypothetical protein Q5H92_14935 [Hymenobacter sp. M29]|uniref:Uncharacterized protein n=1 Tax=Hymenobacter mellowenesis TaxID=3063995 RepID=A0ABT9ACS7_9BACT|nr:hypothetical protein [Hymenobacter sp. M29]MDO7847662.1 hypothetical protein [Hymenobacter sp. M29]